MQAMAAENRRNSEAESAYVRKNVWDDQDKQSDADMGNTILGDVQYPAPIVVSQPQQQSSLPMVALMLASLLPTGAAAAMAGYMWANRKQPEPVVAPAQLYEDESVSIRLGRLDDIE